MPETIRRELRRNGGDGYPAAVLTLLGSLDLVRYGYRWGNAVLHVEGLPGPRGGRRTLCGQSMRSNWWDGTLTFPLPEANWHRARVQWRAVCDGCKTELGTQLNA